MRNGRTLVAAMACAMVLAACGSNGDSGGGESGGKDPLIVGMDSNMGPAHAFASVPFAAGAKAYFDKVNRGGGIDGHQIEFDVRDDRNDAQAGQTNIRALDQKGASVVIGNMPSTVWAATSVLSQQLKLPQWSSGAADEAFYPPQPYLYRYVASSQQVADAMLSFAGDQFGSSSKVALLRYQSAGTDSWSKVITETIQKRDLNKVAESTYPIGSTDMGVPVSSVVSAKPDYVLGVFTDADAPLVVKALRNQGFTGAIVSWVGTSEGTLKAINDPKYYALREAVVPSDPSAAAMMADAKAAGVEADMTSYYGTLGYVNAAMVVTTLKSCGFPCDGEKFESTFAEANTTVNEPGLTGPDYGRDAGKSHLFVNSVGFWALESGATQSTQVGHWYDARPTN